ncbi:hypothetical protein CDIK_4412 [Cucumispora dikerogammari]|nr:hypothetical protein CDIK_4412 [Cucumispora dikerogammari]
MISYSIRKKTVTGKDFKELLISFKKACCEKSILNLIFIFDNGRIHHYEELAIDPEVASFNLKYLLLYSSFLNPIENVFSVRKNLVIRGGAKNELKLRKLISEKFNKITVDHCSNFYRKMLKYLARALHKRKFLNERIDITFFKFLIYLLII